ncbi:dihydrofolate reductase family protein [Streptomyces sp. NPDC048504]|uniref:dihydrofolate reductase family protein n=1 Tax=Streptomyces sp. NPDC048504 TaxID=3365559 RepID=UPI0037244A78
MSSDFMNVTGPLYAWPDGQTADPTQLLERGLIDEIDLHIVPVLLGDGVRLFDNPGGAPVRLGLLNGHDHAAAVNVRCWPVGT